MELVLKTSDPKGPGVRIPLSPPLKGIVGRVCCGQRGCDVVKVFRLKYVALPWDGAGISKMLNLGHMNMRYRRTIAKMSGSVCLVFS